MKRSRLSLLLSSRPCALIALGTLAAACSSSSNPAEPGPPSGPRSDFDVEATLAFGDPPLQGAIRIVPTTNALDWQFAVDVDDDGEPDEVGFIDDGVSIFYRFEAPGTHRIRTTIARGSERFQFEDLLSVNEPLAVRHLVREPIDDGGVTIESQDGRLYVGTHASLLEIDEVTRQVIRRLDFGHPVGILATSPDGERLFVAKEDSILTVDLDGFSITQRLAVPDARPTTLVSLGNGRLVVGSHDGLAVVDTESGVVSNRIGEAVRHIALSPDDAAVATAEFDFLSARVRLVNLPSLTTRWVLDFDRDTLQPTTISFSPDGERVYLLDRGPERRLVVFDAGSGRIITNAIVSDRCGLSRCQRALFQPSSAILADRFVVFPTDIGAYFIDTKAEFKILRLNTDGDSRTGCCSVARSRDGARVFILSDVFIDVVDIPGS